MNSKPLILPLVALISCLNLSANEDQKNPKERDYLIELSYIFLKTDIRNLSTEINFRPNTENSDFITPSFNWGQMGTLTLYKKFEDSIYSLMSGITAAHSGFNFYKHLNTGEQISAYGVSFYGKDGENTYASIRNQFNYVGLDLFVKADLEKTKHADFAVYGGAIVAGYEYKTTTKGISWDEFSSALEINKNKETNSDYFLGPNAKIFVNAPFFNDHLQLSLRLGTGFMMSFHSLRYLNNDSGYNINRSIENTFRFCFQYDVLAQVAFCFNHFSLASGINQFYYQVPKNSNVITFGGPFIKASYEF